MATLICSRFQEILLLENALNAIDIIVQEEYPNDGRINIVAHSMGGILTRLYLQSDNYHNDINAANHSYHS